VRTVETYKTRTMDKLGISSRTALVEYALERGLLDADPDAWSWLFARKMHTQVLIVAGAWPIVLPVVGRPCCPVVRVLALPPNRGTLA